MRNNMDAPLRYRVVAGILIFFAFLAVIAKTVDPDFYWHLQDGEAILATHMVPRVDTYSFTMANMPWVDHEWLVEAGFAWMWNHNLMWALAIIFAIIAFIPFVVWLKRYRSWPALWAIAAGATLFMSFLAIRPQILPYLLFFIVFELLSRYYGNGKDRTSRKKIYLLVMPLVFFVWANIHAQFVSGLALFAVFMLTDAAVAWWREKKIPWRAVPFAPAMLIASTLTPLLNPYGAGLYGEVFRVMFSANTMKYIQEWQSPFTMRAAFSPQTVAIAIVCSLFILLAVKYYKRIAPTQLAAGIVFFLLFAKSIRMGPLFVITAIPVIYGGLTYASIAFSSGWHLLTRKVKIFIKGIGAAVSIGMLCLVLAVPAALGETQITAAQYPAAAVNFLNHSAAQGNKIVLLNTYIWGGYLIWAAPTIKVFIDGRMPHWIAPDGVSAMGDYIKLLLTPVAPDAQLAILKKWGVNTVLISFQDATSGNAGFVATLKSAGWTITYHDATAIILQDHQ